MQCKCNLCAIIVKKMVMQQQQSNQLKNAFEVLANEQYIVLKGGASSLWFNRSHPTPTNGPTTTSSINAAFSPKVAPVPEFRLIKKGKFESFELISNKVLTFFKLLQRKRKLPLPILPAMDSPMG